VGQLRTAMLLSPTSSLGMDSMCRTSASASLYLQPGTQRGQGDSTRLRWLFSPD
jgi:hypothetical protein